MRISCTPSPTLGIGFQSFGSSPRCTRQSWKPAIFRMSSGKHLIVSRESPSQIRGFSLMAEYTRSWMPSSMADRMTTASSRGPSAAADTSVWASNVGRTLMKTWIGMVSPAVLYCTFALTASAVDAGGAVEDIYVVRSLRLSRTKATSFCVTSRTGLAEMNTEDQYNFQSVRTKTSDGTVSDANVQKPSVRCTLASVQLRIRRDLASTQKARWAARRS